MSTSPAPNMIATPGMNLGNLVARGGAGGGSGGKGGKGLIIDDGGRMQRMPKPPEDGTPVTNALAWTLSRTSRGIELWMPKSERRIIFSAQPTAGELVLGSPDLLYWLSDDEGGLLVQIVSFDAADQGVLREILADLPNTGWESIDGQLNLEEEWVIFDGAFSGEDAESEGIFLGLASGQYQVSQLRYKEERAELILVRLQKAQGRT